MPVKKKDTVMNSGEGKPAEGIIEEILKLRYELKRLGRTDINTSAERLKGRSYAELIDEIKYLNGQIAEARKARPRSGTAQKKTAAAEKGVIRLNSKNIRDAVILSEILGKPLSKR